MHPQQCTADPAAAAFDAINAANAPPAPPPPTTSSALAVAPGALMHSAASLPSLPPSAAPRETSSAAPAPAQRNNVADCVVLEHLRRHGFTVIEKALQNKLTSANQAHLSPTKLALDDAQVYAGLRNVVFLLRNAAELTEANVICVNELMAVSTFTCRIPSRQASCLPCRHPRQL